MPVLRRRQSSITSVTVLVVFLVSATVPASQPPAVRASTGQAEQACRELRNLFQGSVLAGTYRGTFSAAFVAATPGSAGVGLRVRTAISGDLEITVTPEGIAELSGTSTYTVTGGAFGIPGGDLEIDAQAAGDLELEESSAERFSATASSAAYGQLLAQAGPFANVFEIAESGEDTLAFRIADSHCRGAEGTFRAALYDEMKTAFAANGLTIDEEEPPTWQISQDDPELEEKLAAFRERLNGISVRTRDLAILRTAAEELKASFDAGIRPCAAAVLFDWIASFLPSWLADASRDLSDTVDDVATAAERQDPVALEAAGNRLRELLIEVGVYNMLASLLGLSGPSSTEQSIALVVSAMERIVNSATTVHQLRDPAGETLAATMIIAGAGAICDGTDPREALAGPIARFRIKATDLYAQLVTSLEAYPDSLEPYRETLERLKSDERWLDVAFGVGDALANYCYESPAC